MYKRLLKIPDNKSFFLFGPRGTGKTTWVKENFKTGLYIDLLEAELFNDLLANPQRLENLIPKNFDNWVVIDEIQRIPDLLNEVHRLIEKYKYKFVLTGSSPRKLRKKGQNLLAGRALSLKMHQFTALELGNKFNLEKSLKYGNLPSVYSESDPQKYLESYVKTYLEEEVRQEGLTRNLSAFSRFLESASFSQGSILNISNVAQDCSVERKVVSNYFNILEDLLIAYRVPPFLKKAKRKLVSHPKFYVFDVGIYRTLRPKGPLDNPHETEGLSFETLVFEELKAINDSLDFGYEIYYWRSMYGQEVDFVLYGERGFKAFEVKRTNKINDDDLKSLRTFLSDYPEASCYLLYGGTKVLRFDNIEVLPIEKALKELDKLLG